MTTTEPQAINRGDSREFNAGKPASENAMKKQDKAAQWLKAQRKEYVKRGWEYCSECGKSIPEGRPHVAERHLAITKHEVEGR